MLHAREDYNRIQDPEGKIPQDEPVFLIRAQDITAPSVVNFWAEQAERAGAKKNIIEAARAQSVRMLQWHQQHCLKIPDMP